MSQEFFTEIFRLFAEYGNDLTIYCDARNAVPDEKDTDQKHYPKISHADKIMLARIVNTLGANYNSKLAKLYVAFEKFVETGEGSVKVIKPDNCIEIIPINTIMHGGIDIKKIFSSAKKGFSSASKNFSHAAKKGIKSATKSLAKIQAQASSPAESDGASPSAPKQKKDTDIFSQLLSSSSGIFGAGSTIKRINAIIGKIDEFIMKPDIGKIDSALDTPLAKGIIQKINQPVIDELRGTNDALRELVQKLEELQSTKVAMHPVRD